MEKVNYNQYTMISQDVDALLIRFRVWINLFFLEKCSLSVVTSIFFNSFALLKKYRMVSSPYLSPMYLSNLTRSRTSKHLGAEGGHRHSWRRQSSCRFIFTSHICDIKKGCYKAN